MNLPRVTDHAVLRFLERGKGFDVEAVRRHIAKVCAAAHAAGANAIVTDGVRFEFARDGTVITATPISNGQHTTGPNLTRQARSMRAAR